MRSEADAQDLVQEAVLEAIQRQNIATPPAPALVFATIHRRAIDWARRESRRAGREVAALAPEPETWFDTTIEERERAQLIQAALVKLTESDAVRFSSALRDIPNEERFEAAV